MIRTILATIVNRFAVMGFAAAVVLLNTHHLGEVGQGQVALITFDILVILAIANYASGGAIVYLTPRIPPHNLWRVVYCWSFLVSGLAFCWMYFAAWHEWKLGFAVAVLALVQSLFTYHMQVLLGHERIREYNILQIVYAGSLAVILFLFYVVQDMTYWSYYVRGAAVAVGLTYLLSLWYSGKHLFGKQAVSLGKVVREMWSYGRWSQSGNVFQTIAYRIPYVLIGSQRLLAGGMGLVGIFSINTYVSEAIWNVSKSLSLIQYSRLSNEELAKNRLKLTLVFFRLSVAISIIPVAVVAFLPGSTWSWLLGDGFGLVALLMPWAAPGILLNSGSMIFSHHFSGSGMHRYNAIASLAACLTVIGVGVWRIPVPGETLVGAAQAFSAGMLMQFLVSLFLFKKREKAGWRDLLVPDGDLELLRKTGPKAG